MATAAKLQTPSRIVRTGTTRTFQSPKQKTGEQRHKLADLPPPPVQDPLGPIRLGVLETYRTLFTQEDVVVGPAQEVLSVAPYETVEVVLESTTRQTVEQESYSETSTTDTISQEIRGEKELTDRVATLIQSSSSSSVSLNLSGTIAIVSAGITSNATYNDARSDSHEVTNRTLQQTSQRVASEQAKRYTFRTTTSREITARELHRRVINNSTDKVAHYALMQCFQSGRAAVQYIGPRLVVQIAIASPGKILIRPRMIGTGLWPTPALSYRGTFISQFNFDETEEIDKTFHWTGSVIPNQDLTVLAARFENGYESTIFQIGGKQPQGEWEATLRATLGKWSVQPNLKWGIGVEINAISSSGPGPVGKVKFRLPTVILSTLSIDTDDLVAYRQIGQGTDDFITKYSELIKSMDSATRRPSPELRLEERDALVRRALREWVPFGITAGEYFRSMETIFDLEGAYYFLSPTSSDVDRPSTIGTYDVATGSSTASRLGAGLGWSIQFDGDDRRNEFINSPFAMVNIPIKQGQELNAISFFKNNKIYDVSVGDEGLATTINNRAKRESLCSRSGFGPDSVDIKKITPHKKEESSSDKDLAEALYPVQSLFPFQEPIGGFLYEPLALK